MGRVKYIKVINVDDIVSLQNMIDSISDDIIDKGMYIDAHDIDVEVVSNHTGKFLIFKVPEDEVKDKA